MMASSSTTLCQLLALLLVVGISATNKSSLIPEESTSGLQVQEKENDQLSPATPNPPVNLIFPQQSLDSICAETIREHLLKFLYRVQQGRQDEDDDDYAPGILEAINSVGIALGFVNETTTTDPIIDIIPAIAGSLHQITGAVNEQLSGTDTPNIPSFLVKQGQQFIASLIANREAYLARIMTTTTTAKTVVQFPGVESIRHSTTTAPPTTSTAGLDPQVEQRESANQFISELLSFLRATEKPLTRHVTTTTTTTTPKPRRVPTTAKLLRTNPTTTKLLRTNPTTTTTATTTTTKRTTTTQTQATTIKTPTDDFKSTSGTGGRPIFWMNMFYPFGIPDLTSKVNSATTTSTTTTTTMKPRRRRRKTTTTLPTTTAVEWEYYDDEAQEAKFKKSNRRRRPE